MPRKFASVPHLFNVFDRGKTYVFEAIYPETKVLIDYGTNRDLVLIGVIDKETGRPEKVPEDIGFRTCRDYTGIYGHIRDLEELSALNLKNQEGFVLYYDNGAMVKLKFPWYIRAHSILDRFMKNETQSVLLYKELSGIMKTSKMKIITIDDVKDSISKGMTDFEDIRIQVPSFYYLMGFDYWLYLMKDIVKNNIRPLFPQPEYFDFEERMQNPNIYETMIWKWENRFLKH